VCGDVRCGERLGSDGEHRHEPAEQEQTPKLSVPEDLPRAAQRVAQQRSSARLSFDRVVFDHESDHRRREEKRRRVDEERTARREQ
jgi:hypothetical protein